MLKYVIMLLLGCAACMPVNKREESKAARLAETDTSVIKPKSIEGLWEQYNQEYESSFVLIDDDTMYLLKGMASKYYIHHDTLMSMNEASFKRKFVKVDANRIIWIDKLHDTIVLKRRQ